MYWCFLQTLPTDLPGIGVTAWRVKAQPVVLRVYRAKWHTGTALHRHHHQRSVADDIHVTVRQSRPLAVGIGVWHRLRQAVAGDDHTHPPPSWTRNCFILTFEATKNQGWGPHPWKLWNGLGALPLNPCSHPLDKFLPTPLVQCTALCKALKWTTLCWQTQK